MADATSGVSGFLASLRRIGVSLVALLRSRVELFAVELQEEKLRTINLLVWLTVALALLIAGILVAGGILAYFLWERAGYAGVVGLGIALLGGAAALLWMLRRRILHGPTPFASTIGEIEKDLACLHSRE